MIKFGGGRTRQPQQAAKINRLNRLGADVQHYQTGVDTIGWTAINGHTRSVGAIGVDTSFAAASLQYLKATSKVTGYPFTLAAVVKRRTTGVNEAVISIGAATNDRHLLYFAADNQVYAFSGADGTFSQAASTTTYTDTSRYYVVVAVFESATSRKIYVDGELKGTDTATVSPATLDTATVGAYWTSGAPVADFYINGDIPVSLISSKAWTAEQVADWSKNRSRHWQIFADRKQNIYVSTASGATSINATPADATASGVAASLNVATGIAPTPANATAEGVAANVSLGTAINTTPANATAEGVVASLNVATGINATPANATAEGVAANVVNDSSTNVNATSGNAAASGTTASLNVATAINATAGNATAEGVAATVVNGDVVVPFVETSYAPQRKTRAPNFAPHKEPAKPEVKKKAKAKAAPEPETQRINRLRMANELIMPDTMLDLMQKRREQQAAERQHMYNIRARAALLAA